MTDENENKKGKDDSASEERQPEVADNEQPEDSQPESIKMQLAETVEKKFTRITPIGILAIFGICAVLAAILVPNFIRARSRGQLTACKSNLKNIGTAMEMYSTDWSGKYPTGEDMALLTPNYLRSIPECPSAGSVTYKATVGKGVAYNTGTAQGFEDYYFVECHGNNHAAVSVPANYPQHDSISGLFER